MRPSVPTEKKEEVIALRKKKWTYDKIARKVSLHPSTVYIICRKAKLSNVRPRLDKRDPKDAVLATLKSTIERLTKEITAADEKNMDLIKQLDELETAFEKERSRSWLDKLIGF
jgi:transcriptional regulator